NWPCYPGSWGLARCQQIDWRTRDRSDVVGIGGLREDRQRDKVRPRQRLRSSAPTAIARRSPKSSEGRGRRSRCSVELRPFADGKAACGCRYSLPACLGLRLSAALDLEAGSPDARQLYPARLSLRSDAHLPDAWRSRAARSCAGEGMDDL